MITKIVNKPNLKNYKMKSFQKYKKLTKTKMQ